MIKKKTSFILCITGILILSSFTNPFPFTRYYFKNYKDPQIKFLVQLQSDDQNFRRPDTFGITLGIHTSSIKVVNRRRDCMKYQRLIVHFASGSFSSDIFEYKSRIAYNAYLDGSGIRLVETKRFEILNFITAVSLLFFLGLFIRGFITYLFYKTQMALILKPYLILNLLFSIGQFLLFRWINDINDIRLLIILELILLAFIEYAIFRKYTRSQVSRLIVFSATVLSNLAWVFAGWIISVLIMFWFV